MLKIQDGQETSETVFSPGAPDPATTESSRLPLANERKAPVLTIVMPTFNERDNLRPLIAAISQTMGDIEWEAVIVDDDSADGTSALAKQIAAEDPRVRCIRRVGRRGLSSAATEGFLSSSAPYVALMDADMQHDQTLLPKMLEAISGGGYDLIVASRYVDGGSAAGLDGKHREMLSKMGVGLSNSVLPVHMTDPMSGFFMMRRDMFEAVAPNLSSRGFKILADIVLSAETPPRILEMPMQMRTRNAGESKLDASNNVEFLGLLLDKTIGRWIPVRFILFSLVGSLGVVVHLTALYLYYRVFALDFALSQGLAALTAMTTNFLLNNVITYRDMRLRGWKLIMGLLSFYAVCSIGLAANVGVASAMHGGHTQWWLSGIIGSLVGVVWNYAAASLVTWRSAK